MCGVSPPVGPWLAVAMGLSCGVESRLDYNGGGRRAATFGRLPAPRRETGTTAPLPARGVRSARGYFFMSIAVQFPLSMNVRYFS